MKRHFYKKGVMLSSVEAWWAGLCARPFDGAQGDTPFFWTLFVRHVYLWAITLMRA
jgi:hypothetical protein